MFVVPATGGVPQAPDLASRRGCCGGLDAGRQKYFLLRYRDSGADPAKFFTVPATGGFPTEIPLPAADRGAFSPDGNKIAYNPDFQWEHNWKHYRGGQTTRVWIANLADSSIEQKIPQENNSNDYDPMWVGDKVYFLSDRNGLLMACSNMT